MIPDSFIQDLLARVDIVDLVDGYVPLKKAGANYAACCPFHNEKSPSFTVSPTKQFYPLNSEQFSPGRQGPQARKN